MIERDNVKPIVFISRAGEDSEIALHIAEILREAGYETFLQDENFGHTSFMTRMAEGFEHVDRNGCLVALLSEAYQKKQHCLKEARYPLISDPNNLKQKLVILRIDETEPRDLLKDIRYVDLSHINPEDLTFDDVVVSAVRVSFLAQHPEIDRLDKNAAPRFDPKIEKLMTFLENEDAEEPGKGLLAGILLLSALCAVLALFEQTLYVWNALFDTSYYAILDFHTVLAMWLISVAILVYAHSRHLHKVARTIEEAHLKISQFNELRNRVAARNWKSDWFVNKAVQTATRNITSRS